MIACNDCDTLNDDYAEECHSCGSTDFREDIEQCVNCGCWVDSEDMDRHGLCGGQGNSCQDDEEIVERVGDPQIAVILSAMTKLLD